MLGDTWSPTASMRTLNYFLAAAAKHKARVHQLHFIGAFLQAKFKNRVFVKSDIGTKDVSEPDLTSRMKYIMVRLEN